MIFCTDLLNRPYVEKEINYNAIKILHVYVSKANTDKTGVQCQSYSKIVHWYIHHDTCDQ